MGHRQKEEVNFTQKMIEKMDTQKGREIYRYRMGIVEPVFAKYAMVAEQLMRFKEAFGHTRETV